MEQGVDELLADWFETNEQIPLLHGAVATRVQHVAERAGLSREVQPRHLRHTYGTILARMGIEPHTFSAVMGFPSPETRLGRRYRETRDFEKMWEDGEDSDPNDR
jgi:site-specific recombinase XerD